jgi:hypothetical protein
MTPAFTRRGLLRAGGAVGAAAVVGTKPWAPAAASASGAPSPLLRSSYASLAGSQFAIDGIGVKLVSVSDLPAAATVKVLAGSEEAFALMFSGPLSPAIESGIHTFRHRRLGEFELFVAPVDIADDDQHYEVVVNSYSGRKLPAPPKPPRREPRKAPPAPPKNPLLRRVAARRIKRGMLCKLSLSKTAHVKSVNVWLVRGKKTIATGSVKHVRGRHHLALRLRAGRRLRNGRYKLLIQTTERDGTVDIKRRRVTLR